MINKVLQPSFEKLSSLKKTENAIIEVDNELLNGYKVSISKRERDFGIELDFVPFKGFSSTMLNAIKFQSPVILKTEKDEFQIAPNSILLNAYKLMGDEGTLKVEGSITQIGSTQLNNFNDKFLRVLIPVLNGRPRLRDIQGYYYNADIEGKEKQLSKVIINENEFHFFSFQIESELFLLVDATVKMNIEDFKRIVANISNAFGFIFGDLFLDEGYFISSNQESFEIVDDIFYSSYRESILSGYSLYTTNPYSIYNVTGKTRAEIDSEIEEIRKWYNKLIEFSPDVFSKLCELFFNKEPYSRAAIITLQANTLALEIKGSSYAIALEAIGNQVLKDYGIKFPKPVSDDNIAADLKNEMLKILDEKLPASNPANKDARAIITSRINGFNSPSNADKLKKPFELVGYSLNDKELKAIKSRDIFQHGNLPADADSDDSVFADVYYYCLLLHRLIAILILKTAGFEGYIVNYPELHSHITAKSNGEDLLYKI
jgi:hypothetical protein